MRRWLKGGGCDWLWLLVAALFFLLFLVLPLTSALADGLSSEEQQLLNAFQAGRLIRLHVVAHSDSEYDQSVKMAVRDAVIEQFGKVLVSAGESFEAALAVLEENTEEMRQTAESCARSHGFEGSVKAETGLMHLPQKQYGQVVLPEGEYHALRITLGNGEGQNWWCVLFPQLCLALSSDEKAVEKPEWLSKRIFQNWLLSVPVHSDENML